MGTVQRGLIKRLGDTFHSNLLMHNDSRLGLFHEITVHERAVSCSYLRPLFRFRVKRVSNHPGLGLLNTPLHKLMIYVFLDICSGSSTAALPLVEEEGKMGLIHSPVH